VISHLLTLGYLKFKEMTDPATQHLMYLANSLDESLQFSQFLSLIFPPLMAAMLLGILLVIIFGIFYSHRLAGPVFNLKRRMRELGEGRFQTGMHIRKRDEFHDVEDAFNEMTEGLRSRLKTLENETVKISRSNRKKIEQLFQAFEQGLLKDKP
jgi:nitrogen fixation/metabolism regulation signal transduction histidine kinase